MTSVLLIATFLTACNTTEQQALDAADKAGALEAGKTLPEYPADCRKKSYSGVRDGDRLDTAVIKTDRALGRQHARTDRCAEWYDTIRAATQAQVP
jgi:hypothetical protein